jgi:carboxyl-terminal processing protease
LKQNFAHDKQADIDRNKAEIVRLLEEEIARRYYYQKARYEASFKSDEDVQEALKLFSDLPRYQALLKPSSKK